MAMPTLPVPIMEIFMWRLVGEGGAASWMGAKNAPAMSRPASDVPDSFFGIAIVP